MPDQLDVVVVAAHGAALTGLIGRLALGAGVEVIGAESCAAALESIDTRAAYVLLVDFKSLGALAFDLLRDAVERWPDLSLIALATGDDNEELTLALAVGATDVIAPDAGEELAFALRKARLRTRGMPVAPPASTCLGDLILGRSRAMQALGHRLEQVASSSASLLIRGESGTGKELVARALHRMSPRADRPFVKIDCAALPDTLLESELFGYEKGAFTGAAGRKLGRVELAHSGTLMLDEIGELTQSTQAKLLRLLQDREFDRLGGTTTLRVDVRVIAATHRDLETMVGRGQFRQDLFYRLNVVPLWLPPLRARRDDIEELASHFCEQACVRNHRPGVTLGAEAIAVLSKQRWPGNVRQLQNFVERLVVLATRPVISGVDVQHELDRPLEFATETGGNAVPSAPAPGVAAEHLSQAVRDAERQALLRALGQSGGNRSAAARVLGVSRTTFYAKLRQYDLL
jgi:two-component system response regulator AtoC